MSSNTVSEETIETALSELYVFLQKECAAILNSLFSDTLIDRDRSELTNSAFINDEEITETQVMEFRNSSYIHTYIYINKDTYINIYIHIHTLTYMTTQCVGVQATERAGIRCGSRYD